MIYLQGNSIKAEVPIFKKIQGHTKTVPHPDYTVYVDVIFYIIQVVVSECPCAVFNLYRHYLKRH